MAVGKNDLILRDRLQFDFDAPGDVATVYGRVDLSDFVNVVTGKGLAIKEVRYQLRDPTNTANTGTLDPLLIGGAGTFASIKMYATTSAYENATDVGISSPNVLSVVEMTSVAVLIASAQGDAVSIQNQWVEWSTPDLHPAGYNVVTDLLIGIAANDCAALSNKTIEVDIMLIAEPITLTKNDLNDMLIQAQDL
jgi:membrane-associated protease RseP (regulator of RpoE activity)